MAYIKVRKQSDGSTRYTAIVRLRRGKSAGRRGMPRRLRSADSESSWRAAAAAKRSLRSALTQVERCVLRFSMQHI